MAGGGWPASDRWSYDRNMTDMTGTQMPKGTVGLLLGITYSIPSGTKKLSFCGWRCSKQVQSAFVTFLYNINHGQV